MASWRLPSLDWTAVWMKIDITPIYFFSPSSEIMQVVPQGNIFFSGWLNVECSVAGKIVERWRDSETEWFNQHNLSPGKDWDDIIPENDRKKIEEEEMNQQMIDLNLPPRHRKKVTQVGGGQCWLLVESTWTMSCQSNRLNWYVSNCKKCQYIPVLQWMPINRYCGIVETNAEFKYFLVCFCPSNDTILASWAKHSELCFHARNRNTVDRCLPIKCYVWFISIKCPYWSCGKDEYQLWFTVHKAIQWLHDGCLPWTEAQLYVDVL